MLNKVNPRIKSRIKTALLVGGSLWLTAIVGTSSYFAYKLSQGPMDGTFAIPLIERALKGNTGLEFDVGAMQLVWRKGKNPLALDIRDITVSGSKGTFLSLSKLDMNLNPIPLTWGQMDIANANIHGIRLRITRLPDGKITLTGSDVQSHTDTTTALTLQDIATRLPNIDHITLKNSSLILEDQKDAIVRHFDNVDLGLNQTITQNITGYITSPLNGRDTSGNAAVDFTYNNTDHTLNAAIAINQADIRAIFGRTLWRAGLPMVEMIVDGRANVTLNNNFLLDDLSVRLKSEGGALRWPRHFGDMPIQTLTNFELDLGYDPDTQTLELTTAQITAKGLTIDASGTLQANENWHELKGDLKLHIPVVAVDLLPEIWPKKWDSDAREWLVDKMTKGRFANINVQVPIHATLQDPDTTDDDDSRKWDVTAGDVKADFNFTGVSVNYNAPMLPVDGVTGTGEFDVKALKLDITSASAKGLKVKSGFIFFNDLITPGAGTAHLKLNMLGTASDVFAYLEPEPINYRKKVGFDLSKTKGNADLNVDVTFPTDADMEVEDVHVNATAKLTNLETPALIKGLNLTGDAFELEASQNHFKIWGDGKLGTTPAKISWHEIFTPDKKSPYTSQVELDLITDKPLRTAFIGDIDDRITGAIPAKLTITTPVSGDTKLSANLNLTTARIDLINPFNFVKERGINSTLTFDATLSKGNLKSIDKLASKGAGLSIENGNIAFSGNDDNAPKSAILKTFSAGQTNADISIEWLSAKSIRANISGKSFDARYIMGNSEHGKDKGDALSYDVNLKLDDLYITNTPITDVTAHFIGSTQGTYTLANLNATAGDGIINLRYNASGDKLDNLFLEITDAGAGLRALGLNERVRGGYLRVEGTPVKGGHLGDMQGKLQIENFTVHGAPTLAKLINTLSLPGLINLLNQESGIKFERALSNVTILNRDGGLKLQLRDGQTSGAALGLTFEGEVDQAKSTLSIQGTVIPMSGINTAIAAIPIIGDILTGGKSGSGIFAATYTLKGNTADPDVMVNPLSVLTPGILRRILFEGTLANDD